MDYERIKTEIDTYDTIATHLTRASPGEFTRTIVGSKLIDSYGERSTMLPTLSVKSIVYGGISERVQHC